MAHSSSICSLVILIITILVAIIALATPFWTISPWRNSGLWADCPAGGDCTWVFGDDVSWQDIKSGWFKAVQVLYTVGVAAGLVAVFFAVVSMCCECKSCNANRTIGGVLILGFVSMAVGIIVYGIMQHKETDTVIRSSRFFVLGSHFGWSYWLAVSSTVMFLSCSITYFCHGRTRTY